MSKKVAVLAGLGALGCFGMVFVVLLIGGGVGMLFLLSDDPEVQPQAYREQPAAPGGEAPVQDGGRTAPVSQTVTLEGRIVDAGTDQGIGGAYFVLLTPGKSYADFQQSNDPRGDGVLEAGAITDSEGNFRISGVRRGYTYTVVGAAPGYQVGNLDHALEITYEDPEVTRLNPLSLPRE